MPRPPRTPALSTVDDILAELLHESFASGASPCMRSTYVSNPTSIPALVPDDATVIREWRSDGYVKLLIEGPGYRGHIEQTPISGAGVKIVATDMDIAERIVTRIKRMCPEPPTPDGVYITVWHGAGAKNRRCTAAAAWDEIAGNYPAGVRTALDQLVRWMPHNDGGRVVVLHGEPGTGKTTAIRTLLWEWRRWSSAHVVTNGEQLLGDPAYLGEITSLAVPAQWHVVVIEDAGNLVDHDAVLGSDVSRLLNLADGIAGSGSRTLFVLTTNERIWSPHRALTRPGRCIANIEFSRFSAAEARRWLGGSVGVSADGMTLAELYDRRSSSTLITNVDTESASTGVYV